MPLPGDVKTITATGDWRDMLGGQISGTVTFVPSATPLLDATDSMWFEAAPIVGTLTGNGTLSLLVPCTDQYTPANWTYEVTESFTSGAGPTKATFGRTYFLALPSTLGSTVSLTGLAPLSVAPAVIGSLPLPSGASPVAGSVPAATGSGQASAWSGSVRLASGAAPSVSLPGLPVGYGNSEQVTGLQIGSAYPSDDINGGTDGTGRINLYSYQRASSNSFGETIRNFLMRWDAKAMTAWYGPSGLYNGSGDPVGSSWAPWAWTGAHYEANDHASIHGHWELEVPDSTGALQGRFACLFADTSTGVIGLDKTTINTNFADLHVYCHGTDHTGAYQQQYFRLTGASGFEKAMEWNNDNAGSSGNRRWKLASTSGAESGSNAGTDWQLSRYDDSGTLLDTPITITRSSGLISLGSNSATAGVAVHRSGGTAFTVNQAGAAAAGIAVVLADTSSTTLEAEVSGDSVQRFTMLSTGALSWGPGTGARDTNLYRASAALLKTDNSFEAATSLGAGVAPTHTFDVASSAAGVLSTFSRTSTSDGTPVVEVFAGDTTTAQALGISVAGDGTNRLGIDPTGKMTWGDGTNARDVELYRSSANVLATDHWFRATLGLRINTTSVGSGVGVLAMANAATLPSGTPSGGGVIYVDAGALKYKGSSGTVTTIASA